MKSLFVFKCSFLPPNTFVRQHHHKHLIAAVGQRNQGPSILSFVLKPLPLAQDAEEETVSNREERQGEGQATRGEIDQPCRKRACLLTWASQPLQMSFLQVCRLLASVWKLTRSSRCRVRRSWREVEGWRCCKGMTLFVSRATTNLSQALRFFQRAIDCYDDALKKFPESFDLAYNKLVKQMPWKNGC